MHCIWVWRIPVLQIGAWQIGNPKHTNTLVFVCSRFPMSPIFVYFKIEDAEQFNQYDKYQVGFFSSCKLILKIRPKICLLEIWDCYMFVVVSFELYIHTLTPFTASYLRVRFTNQWFSVTRVELREF